MTNKSCQKSVMALCMTSENGTYVLWPSEGHACDTGNFFETQTQERLSSFTLRTRLYLIKGGGRGRILLVVMVEAVVVAMVVAMIMVMVMVMVMSLVV